MQILIENYRGTEIFFSTSDEKFTYSFEPFDSRSKLSFAACKKAIDDFIKENDKFIPFDARSISSGNLEGKIIGKRKDGKYILENLKGRKIVLYDYACSDAYIEYKKEDNKIFETRDLMLARIDEIRSEIAALVKTASGKNIYDKRLAEEK